MPKSAGERWRSWNEYRARLCLIWRSRSSGFSASCAAKMFGAHAAKLRVRSGAIHRYFTAPGVGASGAARTSTRCDSRMARASIRTRLTAVTMRRKLAAVRSFFKFLLREGIMPHQCRAAGADAESAQARPMVTTAEQTNSLVDGVALPTSSTSPHPERDLLIFELLYGCGLRISELVGLNLDDFDFSDAGFACAARAARNARFPYGGESGGGARAISDDAPPYRPRSARCSSITAVRVSPTAVRAASSSSTRE